MLDVGDGHLVSWETGGNPAGKPAVVLHGGPGSGCGPSWRRFFDPAAYRTVLFDQRGCGRSTPHASAPSVDLSTNTTHHLLADIELLRRHLGIERWLVFGGSWGSTLGLAYAERHPDRVTELVLFSVVGSSRREVEWVTRDMGRIFPAAWARFRDGVPPGTVTAASSTRTAACCTTPTPPCGRRPRGTGARGRTRTWPSTPTTGRTRATRIRCSGWPSPAWSPITGGTPPGWRTGSCSGRRTGCPASRGYSSTAGST